MKKAISIFLAFASIGAAAQPQLTENNIDEVLGAMNLEEKVTLLVGGARSTFENGIPSGKVQKVSGAAGSTRPLEKYGIPQAILSDGPAGVRISPTRPGDSKTYYATSFPSGTNLASSWDVDLVKEVTSAMGEEIREYGVDVILGPGMNIHRNPLNGRNFEYYSEDPVLSGNIAAAYVNGVQSQGVGVSAKHFAANSQEDNRFENDVRVSVRALREIYLKNFEIMVKKSDPWTIMVSYNKINGTYTQQSRELLEDVLRGDWGFKGITMTDWGRKEATAKAVHAGLDLMCPGFDVEYDRIINAVKYGSLSEEDVTRNARRILEFIVKTPVFKGYRYSDKPDLEAHEKLVRKAGAQTIVLLKNNAGTLPLSVGQSVALFGNEAYEFIPGGFGSGWVNTSYVRNLEDGMSEDGFKIDGTASKWYKDYFGFTRESNSNNEVKVTTRSGRGRVLPELAVSGAFASKMAQANDCAVFVIGRTAGEGADRRAVEGDFYLTSTEFLNLRNVCNAFHAAGKKVVVVMNIGGVIETASWKDMADAIVLAYQPGQEGGASVADVLSGKVNPSGKTPDTFPVDYFDLPSARNFPYDCDRNFPSLGAFVHQENENPEENLDYTYFNEDIYVGYRYFETAGVKPSYPFGFGLSYTTFAYSRPKIKATGDGFEASVSVKNTGSAAGKEVVELYVTAPEGKLNKPAIELKGFAKTGELAPGESQTVTIKVSDYDLASYDESSSSFVSDQGTYEVKFGSSCEDIRATAEYKLTKTRSWKTSDVLHPQYELSLLKL